MIDSAILLIIALIFIGLCVAVTGQNLWIASLSRRLGRAERRLEDELYRL